MCWYSISFTNRAAWNSRSPFQPSGFSVVGSFHSGSAANPAVDKSEVSTFLMSSISRLCSVWKTWWIADSAMFSLHRPSPQTKCAFSISSS